MPRKVLWAYALPSIPQSLLNSPFPALLMAFYAKYTEATTAGIATGILIARLFNGAVDLPIGYLSDRTSGRFGPRKPWLVAGAIVSVFAFWVIFIPPQGAGNRWFLCGMMAFYLAQSLLSTPYNSWSGEISTDYAQRSRISGAQALAMLVGGIAFMAVPEILSHPSIGILRTAALDRSAMEILGLVGMVLMPVAVLIAVLVVPVGTVTRGHSVGVLELRTIVTSNGPFRIYMAAEVLNSISWAITYALMAIVLDDYFGFAEAIVMVLLAATALQVVAIPLCEKLAGHFGKHLLYAWGQILSGALLPLYLLFEPAGQADFYVLLGFIAFVASMNTPSMMFSPSLLADIADFDALKTRSNRLGAYFAMRTMLIPAGGAIGGSFAFYMLGVIGFDPGGNNDAAATQGLITLAVFLPMALLLISGLLMLLYPITRTRHVAIRRVLDRRLVAMSGGDESPIGQAGALHFAQNPKD